MMPKTELLLWTILEQRFFFFYTYWMESEHRHLTLYTCVTGLLITLYLFYHYIIYFIASHRSHSTHFSPSNPCRILFHFHVTHAAFHFRTKPHLFPTLPDWACALQFNKHSYGSHLCLFLYLHSTVVVHLPVPKKDLQPCIFTRVTHV